MRIDTHSLCPSATAHKSHWEGSLSYYCQQRKVFTPSRFTRRSGFAGKTLESRLWGFSLQHKAAELHPRPEAFSWVSAGCPRSGSARPSGAGCITARNACCQLGFALTILLLVSTSVLQHEKHSRKEVAVSPGMITDLVVKNISCSLGNRATIKTLCN